MDDPQVLKGSEEVAEGVGIEIVTEVAAGEGVDQGLAVEVEGRHVVIHGVDLRLRLVAGVIDLDHAVEKLVNHQDPSPSLFLPAVNLGQSLLVIQDPSLQSGNGNPVQDLAAFQKRKL